MLVAVNANQDLLHTGVTLDFFSIQSISAGMSFFLGGWVGGWVGVVIKGGEWGGGVVGLKKKGNTH